MCVHVYCLLHSLFAWQYATCESVDGQLVQTGLLETKLNPYEICLVVVCSGSLRPVAESLSESGVTRHRNQKNLSTEARTNPVPNQSVLAARWFRSMLGLYCSLALCDRSRGIAEKKRV